MSDTVHTLDLDHLGLAGAIACYVLAAPEPTLVDPGPTTVLETLRAGLVRLGIGAHDLRHVLLTHVHLDHAGSVGHVVEAFPRATVYLHQDGAPHLVDPTRLVASTRRTFGEAHDRLWGETRAVPSHRIRAWRSGEPGPWKGLRPVPTPGHISHHLAYLDERDGTLLSGDSMGIVLGDGAPTHPPTPPPAVDLRAWDRTLDVIQEIDPERFGATHFGLHGDVQARVAQLRHALDDLEQRVRSAMATGDEGDALRYEVETRARLTGTWKREEIDRYFDMFPAANDWAGVQFYVKRNP
jgi:glyoxylase-like metal-dependent hydrolase (beta-lactamase superfamily II)